MREVLDLRSVFVSLSEMYANCTQRVNPSFLQGVHALLSASNLVSACMNSSEFNFWAIFFIIGYS